MDSRGGLGCELRMSAKSQQRANFASTVLIHVAKFTTNTITASEKTAKTMAESIDAVSVYYRTALKARLQDPNESLQSVPQLESSLPACPCPKTITDISKLICNVCLIKMIEIRLEAMSGFQRTEFNRREQIYRDQLSISDGAVKDLRREGRIREVKINNLTSECKFLRKSNDILHDAIKNSNSILRNNGLANLESPFEQPWKVSDTAKAALASEEFEDTAPKKTKSNDPAPTSIEKIVEEAATNTFTAKVNEAEQAIKNAIETAKAEFTQQLTDAKNEIDTKIAEIKNDVGKIPDELKGHTEEEMLRITEYTTGQFRELLNYPELASIQINFRTRSVACDVDFFHQRLLIYHALVRDGTINKHDTNSSNAKYVNYRSKNTGRTFGNIIELNNSFRSMLILTSQKIVMAVEVAMMPMIAIHLQMMPIMTTMRMFLTNLLRKLTMIKLITLAMNKLKMNLMFHSLKI